MIIICIEKKDDCFIIKQEGNPEQKVFGESAILGYITKLDNKNSYNIFIKNEVISKEIEIAIFKLKNKLSLRYLDERTYEIIRALA
jgi:hypothetical protein